MRHFLAFPKLAIISFATVLHVLRDAWTAWLLQYIPENFEANNLPLEFYEMHRREIQDCLLASHFDGYP